MSILKISNLTIADNKEHPVIKNISMDISKNSFTTVIGNSGSGKTVLIDAVFNLLSKNLDVKSGDILYDKQSVFNTDNYQGDDIVLIFNSPGIIFNDNYKIEKQIQEMLLLKKKFNNKKEIKEQLYYYLKLLDIPETVLKKYPSKIDNKNIKKIAVILAVLFKPKILIIDDSFHSLDSITIKLIYLLLKSLKNKITIIFFTSINSSVIGLSDFVYYMYKGCILESLNNNKLRSYKLIHPYRKLFNNEVDIIPSDDLTEGSKGCIYYNVCFKRKGTCLTFDNTLKEYEDGHFLSCINLED